MAVTIRGSGQIIVQVIQYRFPDVWSSTSTSFVDVTNFNATITPTSSSNKVLMLASIEPFHTTTLQDEFRILRNGTDMIPSIGGRLWFSSGYYGSGTTAGASTCYIDSPASTSALTYQVQARNRHGGTLFIGKDWNGDTPAGMNTITLMEISG
jgi:hypothetical protein